MAAPVRFELTRNGVRVHCLTAWLWGNLGTFQLYNKKNKRESPFVFIFINYYSPNSNESLVISNMIGPSLPGSLASPAANVEPDSLLLSKILAKTL